MAEYTECAADIVEAFDSVPYANGALLLEETADASSEAEHFASYQASSTGAATSSAAGSALTIVSGSSTAASTSAAEPGQLYTDTSTADSSSEESIETTLSVSSTAAASASASPSGAATISASSEAEASDAVGGRVIVHNETSTADGASAVVTVVEMDVSDTVSVASSPGASANKVYSDVSTAASTSATAQALSANAVVDSAAVIRATAIVVDDSYPALWANSQRMASAVWKAVPFESYVVFDGALLGAGPDGLYAFTETEDYDDWISARVVGDLTDYGSNKKKNFDAALLSASCSGPLRVGVETEQGSYHYVTHLTAGSNMPATHRAPIGRGLTGRFVRFSFDNLAPDYEGATFSVNEAEAGVGDTGRVR